MKLRDIANNIIKNKDKNKSMEGYVDIYNIAEELDLVERYNDDIFEQNRLKCYFFAPYYSTDSWVGLRMYFLDEEPVCYSSQYGRKCDEEFVWFSIEKAKKVKEYILSFKKDDEETLSTIDLDTEVEETYKMEFNEEVLDWNYGLYNGKPFKLIEEIQEEIRCINKNIKIEQDGKQFIVNIKDIDFKYWGC